MLLALEAHAPFCQHSTAFCRWDTRESRAFLGRPGMPRIMTIQAFVEQFDPEARSPRGGVRPRNDFARVHARAPKGRRRGSGPQAPAAPRPRRWTMPNASSCSGIVRRERRTRRAAIALTSARWSWILRPAGGSGAARRPCTGKRAKVPERWPAQRPRGKSRPAKPRGQPLSRVRPVFCNVLRGAAVESSQRRPARGQTPTRPTTNLRKAITISSSRSKAPSPSPDPSPNRCARRFSRAYVKRERLRKAFV